ncbi:DNA topoisomerase [Bacteroides thetaiotaomicron]|uniref:type IA DNA topoisomerase n=1 Tax=Bacteroides thetaiotaomicron TaxID=818 RepID=UPI00286D9BE8|nr:DNA topoisomerase [Bacteroides thetaiotaomicron]MCS3010738.1 DNA topoisomerase [Bacteroides thetaiotaomicron]
MKTIIAEKPSVAKEIAHIVGADKREEGYMQGNGYFVTWAFGHLVQPAMPETYGMKGFHAENLPVIPDPFVLVPRQVKTVNGYKADAGVLAQIKIIGKLFDSSERIIVATDAGREGELIFRYLYAYLGCQKPFDRLWISSLTDTAIREGLQNLTDSKEYDNLYHAAKARSEADWLVGINGTQALTIAAGRGTYSVGRVQTPTLGMVCERYWEHKRFESKPFWQVHFGVVDADSGNILKFTSVNRWTDKATATDIYNKVKDTGSAIITKVATKRKVEKAPLLYDLTTLQKEANSQHGFTAEHTLSIAQKLYEAKFITYPRTSSRYISDDVFATLPKLFKNLENHSEYGEKVKLLPGSEDYSKNSVNAAKVTDHHALLITENAAIGLFKDEKTVYDMILCRMIEAFSADCIKDITSVSAQVDHEVEFGISGSIIRQTGWRALSLKEKNNRQDKDADATDNEVKDQVIPNWQEGQHVTFSGCTITEGKTKPKPLHTESTLLAAMETAGKEIEDDTMCQAMKDCGIGTPATRAAIIETLLKREYMVRQQKKLVPTEKGLALHSVVKNMAIANVEMTGKWEAELAKIERGEASADGFTHSIEGYTREITAELLGCDRLFSHKDSGCQCPKCKHGTMQFFGKVVRCSNKECGMPVFKQVAGKLLTDADITDLLTKGKTRTLNGFTSKQGKSFSAAIAFDENFNTKFVFAEHKTAEKRGNVKRYKK